MRIARVVGSAVSTIKVEALRGSKLLVVQAATPNDEVHGEPFVAVDIIGAGEGELVLIGEGSAARQSSQTVDAPVDAVIMAILDSLDVNGQMTFRKN